MTEGLAIVDQYESLPPNDARLIDPSYYPHERIITPVDDRGLIDIPQLIQDVKATIDPSYVWPPDLSVHHFYWPAVWYPVDKSALASTNPSVFRNLPIHKGLVLRTFENWLHKVTIPPEMPKPEVMQYRVEAWTVASDLFKMARKTIQWEKRARRRRELLLANPSILPDDFEGVDIIGEEIMHEVLERNFRGFEYQLLRQERIPEAFRIMDISGSPERIAQNLGRVVARPSLHLVHSIAS